MERQPYKRHAFSWLTDANYGMIFTLPPSFATNFLWSQLRPLPYPTADFTGKTVIVTGANAGLGREAARHFVRLGAARVVLGCRSAERGEAARRDIIEASEGGAAAAGSVVEVWPLDLASFDSVRAFCRRADEELERLDAVVESAAVATGVYVEAEAAGGHEMSVAVNVISTFFMAVMLLPALRRTAKRFGVTPHLVIVSSDAHYFARFREASSPGGSIFAALRGRANMTEDRYNVTKLLDIMLVRELSAALGPDDPVVLNTPHPGFCRSELFRHAAPPLSWLIRLGLLLIGRTAEMGSRTLVAAASAGSETRGEYLDSCRVAEVSPYVRSDEGRVVQRRVYDELLAILEGIEPGVTKNI